MKHADEWRPTKYVFVRGGWHASHDLQEVAISSRIMVERIAYAYTAALKQHARGDLVDLGCGHVPLYGAYRDLAASVTCVDWANSPHPSRHIDIAADLGKPVPLPDVSFDTILLTDVLEHLPYPDKVWSEAQRLLRPGGMFLVGVPFLYWLHEEPHDHYRYTEHRLRLFCADHGFGVVSLRPYGCAIDVVFDAVAKTLGNRRSRRLLVRCCVRVGERLGRSRRELPTKLPLGYLLVAQKTD